MTDDAPVVYDKYRGEVEFKYLPNAVFRYRLKDLAALSEKLGSEYLKRLEDATRLHDAAVIELFIRAGLKQKGGGIYQLDENTIADPAWPVSAVYGPIREAIMFAITGMTGEEAAAAERAADERFRKEVEEKFQPGPSEGRETSSSASAGKDSVTA